MNTYAISQHAQSRIQQRGIPPIIVELLGRFGASVRSHGADRLYFDRISKKKLLQYLGGRRSLKIIEQWLDVYMIVADDGTIVTSRSSLANCSARFTRLSARSRVSKVAPAARYRLNTRSLTHTSP